MQQIINFSGMDGSGKTTALQKIGPILRSRGFTVFEVKTSYFDRSVYDYVELFEAQMKCEQLLERFMHVLDLRVVINNLPKVQLAEADFILFDRHFVDKRVFFELRTGHEWPAFFERLVSLDYYPQTNLYFNVAPEIAAWRLSRMRNTLDWKEKPETLTKAPALFDKYLAKDHATRRDIDANLSENLVLNQVMTALIGSKFND